MQIATYNIWNSEMGVPYRTGCIIREISGAEADVICLQEVQNKGRGIRIFTLTAIGIVRKVCVF